MPKKIDHNQNWNSNILNKENLPMRNRLRLMTVRCASNLQGTLTHWGRVTHICVSNLTIISSDGLLPGRRQAIIWSNAGILLIRSLGTNFSEILSKIHTFSFKKMHFIMSSAKWRQVCLSLNVLSLDALIMVSVQTSFAHYPRRNGRIVEEFIIYFWLNGECCDTNEICRFKQWMD